MAWIDLPDDDATPKLDRLTKPWRKAGQPVPAVVGVMKPAPATLRAVLRLNDAASFGGSSLPRRTEELLAVTTSAMNECFY
jgi:hypothetical protein